jgi:hypothetical protein
MTKVMADIWIYGVTNTVQEVKDGALENKIMQNCKIHREIS